MRQLDRLWITAAGLALAAGCNQWSAWRPQQQRPAAVQPQAQAAPTRSEAPPAAPEKTSGQPASPDNVQARVDQYLASLSIDSLSRRVERYRQARRAEPTRPASRPAPIEPAASPPEPAAATSRPSRPQQATAIKQQPEPAAQRPPTVVALQVRPEPPLAGPAPPPEPVGGTNKPLEATTRPASDIQAMIQRLENQLAAQPNQPDAQLTLRLLYLLTGREQQALAAIDGTDAELQELLQAVINMLAAIRPTGGHGLAANADRALAAVDRLRQLLQAEAALRVTHLVLCRRVESFGVYEPIEPLRFTAGKDHPVIVYCEVSNFQTQPTEDGRYKTLLAQRLSIYSADGKLIYQKKDEQIADLSRNRRQDFFLARILHLPESLQPGRYVLKAAVTDLLASKEAEARLEFVVEPPD